MLLLKSASWMLLLACRCGGERDPVDIGFTGTDSEFVAAVVAASEWNDTCERDLIHLRRGKGEVSMYGQQGPIRGTSAGYTHGDHEGVPRYIVFQSDVALPLMPIMAHELGHALGLGHAPEGLMRRKVGPGLLRRNGRLVSGAITSEQCQDALRVQNAAK